MELLMPLMVHEIWEDQGGHSFEMGPVCQHSDEVRAKTAPESVLRHTFLAASRFEAYQMNYDWHGWGERSKPDIPDHFFTEEEVLEQGRYIAMRDAR